MSKNEYIVKYATDDRIAIACDDHTYTLYRNSGVVGGYNRDDERSVIPVCAFECLLEIHNRMSKNDVT